jgi:hypothetical protein
MEAVKKVRSSSSHSNHSEGKRSFLGGQAKSLASLCLKLYWRLPPKVFGRL